jgi:uncharacterized membrane protein
MFILGAAGIVLAIICAAVAINLGGVAQEARRNQKVADLAALDASRTPTPWTNSLLTTNAQASATKNKFNFNSTNTVTAVEGVKSGGSCVSQVGSGKVCVTVTSHYANLMPFVSGGNDVTRTAMASASNPVAGFSIGSSLADVNLDDATENVPVLNRFFGRLLGGASGQASLVSYKGLADASVKLGDLQSALGFGTVNSLLNGSITMGQLLTATSTVLNNQGTVAALNAKTLVGQLQSVTNNATTIKLGDFIHVSQGQDSTAAATGVNVLQLITAGAELANKNSFIDGGALINLPVTLGAPLSGTANVSTSVGIKVIQPPQICICKVGESVSTAQVQVTLTPHLDVNLTDPLYNVLSLLSIIGTSNLQIVGDMPVTFTGAGATGTMEAINCTAPQGITVGVVSNPITTHSTANLQVYLQSITPANFVTSNVKVNVSVQPSDVATSTGGPYHEAFSYPTEFTPPATGKTTPGAPLGLNLSTSNVTATVGAAGLTQLVGLLTGTLKVNDVLSSVIGPILQPTINAVLAKVQSSPAFKALGVSIGPVDVAALADAFKPGTCGNPALLG